MSDYLMRDDAPLTDGEWERIDSTVVHVARQYLVGRRVLDLKGPLGPGLEMAPVGVGDGRRFVKLQVFSESFMLYWRDIAASRESDLPLEVGPAAHAAMAVAQMEDEMIFNSLLDASTKNVGLGDWSQADTPLADVVAATELLFSDGFLGPYAVILNPTLFTLTQRIWQGMGRTVGALVKEVAEGGLFRTPVLQGKPAMVLSLGAFNFDLLVGQDLVTAYQGNEGLDHSFRVLETMALRIKRPGAICTLG
jgi:uncharacterized linocin/CFP29 family protein